MASSKKQAQAQAKVEKPASQNAVTDEQLAPIVECLKAGDKVKAAAMFGDLCESIPGLPHWGMLALKERIMKAAGLIKPRPTKD